MSYKNFRNHFSAIFSLTIFTALLSFNPSQVLLAAGGVLTRLFQRRKVEPTSPARPTLQTMLRFRQMAKLSLLVALSASLRSLDITRTAYWIRLDGDGRRSITLTARVCSGQVAAGLVRWRSKPTVK